MKQAIICVDDEAIILMSLKMELKEHFGSRYQYETAINADAAERLLAELEAEQTEPVLMVSDWLMPGKKGDALLKDAHIRHPRMAKVLITGQADAESIEKARSAGAIDACIPKPWHSAVLMKTLEDLLEKRSRDD